MTSEQKETLSKELEAHMHKALINGASSLHLVFIDFMVSKIEQSDAKLDRAVKMHNPLIHERDMHDKVVHQKYEAKLEAARNEKQSFIDSLRGKIEAERNKSALELDPIMRIPYCSGLDYILTLLNETSGENEAI